MRVFLLVTDHQLGGTPLRLARLARGLRAAGVDVIWACLSRSGPLTRALASEGFEISCCDARGGQHLAVLLRLRRAVRLYRPDLIHSALFHANIAARIVGRIDGIPVLTSTATIECERKWHIALERLTAGWDIGHMVNSRALADHVQDAFGVPAHRIHIGPPSVQRVILPEREVARRVLRLNDEFAVFWSGRFDPVKRLDVLVAVAARLRGQGFQFLLAGDGPLRPRVERWVRELALDSQVRLLGWQNSLALPLAAADAFLMPSLTEGMPNAMLEAMAAGVPVIAADIPVARELAGDPQRLLLVQPAHVEGFAAALLALRAGPAHADAIAKRAQDWIERSCDDSVAVSQTIALYRSFIGSRRSAGTAAGP